MKIIIKTSNQVYNVKTILNNIIPLKQNKRSPFNFIGKETNLLFGIMDKDEKVKYI